MIKWYQEEGNWKAQILQRPTSVDEESELWFMMKKLDEVRNLFYLIRDMKVKVTCIWFEKVGLMLFRPSYRHEIWVKCGRKSWVWPTFACSVNVASPQDEVCEWEVNDNLDDNLEVNDLDMFLYSLFPLVIGILWLLDSKPEVPLIHISPLWGK